MNQIWTFFARVIVFEGIAALGIGLGLFAINLIAGPSYDESE